MGIGIIKTISMSKTRNTTANRKNRRENGSRADLFGSNPHSKAEHFSRSFWLRADSVQARIATTLARSRAREKQKRDKFILWK